MDKIPHLAVITVRGVVNKQMPDGFWHPAATFNDGFTFQFEGMSEAEAIATLKKALEGMKEACQNQSESN